jgi:hypothetical protein
MDKKLYQEIKEFLKKDTDIYDPLEFANKAKIYLEIVLEEEEKIIEVKLLCDCQCFACCEGMHGRCGNCNEKGEKL